MIQRLFPHKTKDMRLKVNKILANIKVNKRIMAGGAKKGFSK